MKKVITLGLALLIALTTSLCAQAKRTETRIVYSLAYSEHNDGCLVRSGHYHYKVGIYTGSIRTGGFEQISPPEHRNDNAFVKAEINRFNREIERLNAVPYDDQQIAFNSTPIGSWYFVYRVNQEYGTKHYSSINKGIPRSETFVIYHCVIWRVDVVADR